MKCGSEKNRCAGSARFSGFSLPEVVAAVVILGLVCSGVLVVINRAMSSVIDTSLRMQAFEIARNNMEELLASSSVQEMSDNGVSDKYPGIEWQTAVETFYEPITNRMWIRGVCSAEYIDTAGELQKVELVHWLTNLTKQQMLEILREMQKEQELADQIIETIEEAAEYAGVDEETIQQWVANGMLTTEDGSFIKDNLDLYKQTGGNPTPEQREHQTTPELIELILKQEMSGGPEQPSSGGPEQPSSGESDWLDQVDPMLGITYRELAGMSPDEIWQLCQDKGLW